MEASYKEFLLNKAKESGGSLPSISVSFANMHKLSNTSKNKMISKSSHDVKKDKS